MARFPTNPILDIVLLRPFPNEAVTGYIIAWPVSQRSQYCIYYCIARFRTKPILYILLLRPFPNEAATTQSRNHAITQPHNYAHTQLRNHSITQPLNYAPPAHNVAAASPWGGLSQGSPPELRPRPHKSHITITSHKSQYRRQALNQSNNMSVADRFEPIRK